MNSDAHNVLKFTKLSEHAFPPVKGSEKAAGFDLKRSVTVLIIRFYLSEKVSSKIFKLQCLRLCSAGSWERTREDRLAN